MNITLTDIRSLTLDLQEIPEVARSADGSFARLMQQQLPVDSEDGGQVIEFKEFFENLAELTQAPELGSDNPAVAAWQDYLSDQKISITTDSDPLIASPVDVDAVLLDQRQPVAAVSDPAATVTGGQLPVGGNSLPDGGVDLLSGALIGSPQLTPQGESPIAATGPAPAVVGASLDAARMTSVSVPIRIIGVSTDAGGVPVKLTPEALPSSLGDSVSNRVADSQTLPEAGAGINKLDDVKSGNRNQVDSEGRLALNGTPVMIPRAEVQGTRIPGPAALSDSPPDGLALSANLTREIVSKDLPVAREAVPAGPVASGEIRPASSSLQQREVTANLERAGFHDLPDAIKSSLQSVKSPPETVIPELAANRGFELPQQVSSNQAQQTITALSAGGHGQANLNPAILPATGQSTLSPQLETLNLARSSDSGEWGNGLGERVNWMINQKQNSAIIRLDPPMLGKLDVQIKIADDATTIMIQTQHAQTRDLIETASARLRDFLQESGYQNVNVDVSQRQDQQQARAQATFDEDSGNRESNQEEESTQAQHQPDNFMSGDGLLDTFA